MNLLKGGLWLRKLLIILTITITLISPPDQCEATKCHQCRTTYSYDADHKGPDTCEYVSQQDCPQSPSCATGKITANGGGIVLAKHCNWVPACFKDKYQIGTKDGCTNVTVKDYIDWNLPPEFPDHATKEDWVCSGDVCNGGALKASGKGSQCRASSLKRTATRTGLMIARAAIVAVAVLLP